MGVIWIISSEANSKLIFQVPPKALCSVTAFYNLAIKIGTYNEKFIREILKAKLGASRAALPANHFHPHATVADSEIGPLIRSPKNGSVQLFVIPGNRTVSLLLIDRPLLTKTEPHLMTAQVWLTPASVTLRAAISSASGTSGCIIEPDFSVNCQTTQKAPYHPRSFGPR